MYKGSIGFVAEVRGNGLKFPRFEFNPNEQGVDKVEIGLPNGEDLKSVVRLACVPSPDDGMALAIKVNTAALDRIAFLHNIAIENARVTRQDFSSLDDQPGAHVAVAAKGSLSITGNPTTKLSVGLPPERLKAELEQSSVPAERYYGLFRSARQSSGPTEEFMHLYNILLMLLNDEQPGVDRFIVREEPNVQQTPRPPVKRKARQNHGSNLSSRCLAYLKSMVHRKATPLPVMETVYSCLRNEFAHPRAGVNVNNTKAKMESCLGDLRSLTKRAIELHEK
jgi:hypothetical protein